MNKYIINCTGDVCVGDIIKFREAVFLGSYGNTWYEGDRTITAEIKKDSYGQKSQQHTFTLRVIKVEGAAKLDVIDIVAKNKRGEIKRKGRNIYKNGTLRMAWENESDRLLEIENKHKRGNVARADRDFRKGYTINCI